MQAGMRPGLAALLVLFLAAPACRRADDTTLHAIVTWDGLTIDQLEFSVAPAGEQTRAAVVPPTLRPEQPRAMLASPQDVLIRLRDDEDGLQVACRVRALYRGELQQVVAAAPVTVRRRQIVTCALQLPAGTAALHLPNGTACLDARQCASGNCVDGLCCDSHCDGTCMACGDDGLCDEVPADDDDCGTIDCDGLDSTCRDYDDLTAARCAGFGVCMNPEFMREGSSVEDFFNPPFTLIGELDAPSGDTVAALYHDVWAPLHRTQIRVAEMLKYACNSFHALKVCFSNEIGNICKTLSIDSHEVMRFVCLDTKLNISPYYMKPGFAFGGSCLPKDLRARTYKAR